LLASVLTPAVHAIPLEYSLSGVTFNDGGTASGYFIYDPTTQVSGQFDIFTTGGHHYIGSGFQVIPDFNLFGIYNSTGTELQLVTTQSAVTPGVYQLQPGHIGGLLNLLGSGETVAFPARLVTTGSLVVTAAPDGGQTITLLGFSFLLLVVFRRPLSSLGT
jgi:hypothetical protein